jgi:hypothetical protein
LGRSDSAAVDESAQVFELVTDRDFVDTEIDKMPRASAHLVDPRA